MFVTNTVCIDFKNQNKIIFIITQHFSEININNIII